MYTESTVIIANPHRREKMDVEASIINFDENGEIEKYKSNFGYEYQERNYFYGRVYLNPRVVSKKTNLPMTVKQIY
jgi:hypothetical protein